MSNYYNKYIKYKSKYLELKNKYSVDTNNYLNDLKKLYPNCIHDIKVEHPENYSNKGYAIVYGEMDYDAIDIFNKKFNNNFHYFFDFGSGRGKLPLFMAFYVNYSIGIELVTERHNDAVKLKNDLAVKYKSITDKTTFINDDMFNYLNSVNKTNFDTPALIWISNLCFSNDITTKLFNELIIRMPSDSIIGCSKIPSVLPDGVEPVIIDKTNQLSVPMSWNKHSNIYIYKIK